MFTYFELCRNAYTRVEGSERAGEVLLRLDWRFRDAAFSRHLESGDEGRASTWSPIVMSVLLRLRGPLPCCHHRVGDTSTLGVNTGVTIQADY
jgi:hypothetical protein